MYFNVKIRLHLILNSNENFPNIFYVFKKKIQHYSLKIKVKSNKYESFLQYHKNKIQSLVI